jgi:adenylosuccinate lyase
MKPDFVTELTSITPIDGRYRRKTQELSQFLSEFALIKYRIEVEIKYLIALSKAKVVRKLTIKETVFLENIYKNFSLKDASRIKKLEDETRHDIKAVEKYLIFRFKETSLNNLTEFIHICLTSEDINNLAYRLMLKNAIETIILNKLMEIKKTLLEISKKHSQTIMLARTHGQAAIPTTFGKEVFVFYKRIEKEIKFLEKQKLTGKLNGAVGNFNSFNFVFPEINWPNVSKQFIDSFGLEPNIITTQINPFEDIINLFQNLQRINGILLDLNQDLWRYISDDWLILAVKKAEVGSSTMPQKVNPIDFENSEGNLTLANGLMQVMIDKLYVSRLQRDLSNSTIIRNMGTVLGFCLMGYKSLSFGLSRIDVNKDKMFNDLNKDWGILSEGLQTYLRSKDYKDSYNFIASFTKGKRLDEHSWKELINSLKIPESDKQKILKLTPRNYLGIAKDLIN